MPQAVRVRPDELGQQAAVYPANLQQRRGSIRWTVARSPHPIDEAYFVGTNTGSLTGPNGETIPATGRRVRSRECDVVTVENGVVTSHRFYFDVQDWLTQLGLAPESPA